MLTLLLHDRTLQIRGMLALLMFGAFSLFGVRWCCRWAGAVQLHHAAVGAFGTVGAVGARWRRCAPGILADRGLGQAASGVSAAVDAGLAAARFARQRPVWLVAGIVLLDAGGRAIHVLNQSMIFSATRSRTAGWWAAMLFYAVGSGLGALPAPYVCRRGGAASAGWGRASA